MPVRTEDELRKLATHRVGRKKPQTTRAPARVTTPVHVVPARPARPVYTRLPDRFATLSREALQLLWNARIEGHARCPACANPGHIAHGTQSARIALGLAVSSTPFLYRFACGQCGWLSQWFRVFPSNVVAETSFDTAAGG